MVVGMAENIMATNPAVNVAENAYIPSDIVREGHSGLGRERSMLNEDYMVHSEGGMNFSPTVRNINFHIQIS